MRKPAASRRSGPAATLVAAALVGSCGLTDVDNPRPVGFEGAFEPESPEFLVSGNAAALSQFGNTEVGLNVSGLEPETEFAWLIREGTCEGEGEPLIDPDALPLLETDEEGSASLELTMGRELSSMEDYAVELFDGPSRAEERLACADLDRTV